MSTLSSLASYRPPSDDPRVAILQDEAALGALKRAQLISLCKTWGIKAVGKVSLNCECWCWCRLRVWGGAWMRRGEGRCASGAREGLVVLDAGGSDRRDWVLIVRKGRDWEPGRI